MTQLTITRREGKFIRVGEDVFIELRKARGGIAKLTIHAPKDVEIVRDEIDDQVAYEETDEML